MDVLEFFTELKTLGLNPEEHFDYELVVMTNDGDTHEIEEIDIDEGTLYFHITE